MTLPTKLLGPEGYDPGWDDARHDMYFDRQGNPMTLRQWVTGMECLEYRTVARTEVGDATILTMWMGLDIDANLCEKAHVFGTIMQDKTGFHDEEVDHTEAEALVTHNKRVSELRSET